MPTDGILDTTGVLSSCGSPQETIEQIIDRYAPKFTTLVVDLDQLLAETADAVNDLPADALAPGDAFTNNGDHDDIGAHR